MLLRLARSIEGGNCMVPFIVLIVLFGCFAFSVTFSFP